MQKSLDSFIMTKQKAPKPELIGGDKNNFLFLKYRKSMKNN